ncbi:MAG: hypothetical protein LBG20_04170 [Holosporaceae bacterium]|jgi:hypothetical protein|nr:hypothetical protein [Holosporaceae bacterium]
MIGIGRTTAWLPLAVVLSLGNSYETKAADRETPPEVGSRKPTFFYPDYTTFSAACLSAVGIADASGKALPGHEGTVLFTQTHRLGNAKARAAQVQYGAPKGVTWGWLWAFDCDILCLAIVCTDAANAGVVEPFFLEKHVARIGDPSLAVKILNCRLPGNILNYRAVAVEAQRNGNKALVDWFEANAKPVLTIPNSTPQ